MNHTETFNNLKSEFSKIDLPVYSDSNKGTHSLPDDLPVYIAQLEKFYDKTESCLVAFGFKNDVEVNNLVYFQIETLGLSTIRAIIHAQKSFASILARNEKES